MDTLALLEEYKKKGIIIDTNLMLLLAVGHYSQNRILTFKRTLKYTLSDFLLVRKISEFCERRVTTPNILTEVDNLIRQLPAVEHSAVAYALKTLMSELFELYVPTVEAVQAPQFALLGLTDTVIASSEIDVLVVTDDFRLSNIISGLGRNALNINHIRTFED